MTIRLTITLALLCLLYINVAESTCVVKTNSVAGCKQICQIARGCIVYTWNENTYLCMLKESSKWEPHLATGYHSGYYYKDAKVYKGTRFVGETFNVSGALRSNINTNGMMILCVDSY